MTARLDADAHAGGGACSTATDVGGSTDLVRCGFELNPYGMSSRRDIALV
jgi:hypothetical protein